MISGGEPTISPYFFDLINHLICVLKCKSIIIHINARKLASDDFINRFKDFNYTFLISIHSNNDYIHNRMSGNKDAFYETVKGIENINTKMSNEKIRIHTSTVITEMNLKSIPGLVSRLTKYEKVKSINLRLPIVLPDQKTPFLIDDLYHLTPILDESYEIAMQNGKFFRVFNITFCLFGKKLPESKYPYKINHLFMDCENQGDEIGQGETELASILKKPIQLNKKIDQCKTCKKKNCVGLPYLYDDSFRLALK